MNEAIEPEIWSNETISEFLLNNSLTEEEYRRNLLEVVALGVDPLTLPVEHLIQDDPWAKPELHMDILRSRRSS
jgi:hypothetical protein